MEHLNLLILSLINFEKLIFIFDNIPVEIIWLCFLFFCFSSILIFLKLFGELGLYIYTVIAIIGANIQVLKVVKFSFQLLFKVRWIERLHFSNKITLLFPLITMYFIFISYRNSITRYKDEGRVVISFVSSAYPHGASVGHLSRHHARPDTY